MDLFLSHFVTAFYTSTSNTPDRAASHSQRTWRYVWLALLFLPFSLMVDTILGILVLNSPLK